MTTKVTFWNLRGGSGKSTLALGLAKEILRREKTVGVLDMDSIMQNPFDGVPVTKELSDDFDFLIIDCPPSLAEEVIEVLKISDVVVIPHHCCSSINMEDIFQKYCDPRNTYLVPTWYKTGSANPKSKFPVLNKKLHWSVPVNYDEVSLVCEELADSILGRKKN